MRKPEFTYYGISGQEFNRYHLLKPYFENLKEAHQDKWTKTLYVILIPVILYSGGWHFLSDGGDLGYSIVKGIMLLFICAIIVGIVSIPLSLLTWKIELFLSSRDYKFYLAKQPIILRFETDLEIYRKLVREKEKEEERKRQEALRQQKEFWRSLTGIQFETEIASLFEKLGYEVTLTRGSGDEGVDLYLNKNDKISVVQCKAHKKPVAPSVVRDLYGTMLHNRADEAILVTLAGFTLGVKNFVEGKPIELMSLSDIIKLQNELVTKKEFPKKQEPLPRHELTKHKKQNISRNPVTVKQPIPRPEYQDNRTIAERYYSQGIGYKRSGNSHEAIESIKKAARLGHQRARQFLEDRKIIW